MRNGVEESMRILLKICRLMCRQPHKLKVDVVGQSQTTARLQLVCHPDDNGTLIGKSGARFRALRFLVERIGDYHDMAITLSTIVKAPGVAIPFPEFKYNHQWPKPEVVNALLEVSKILADKPGQVSAEAVDGTRRNSHIKIRSGILSEQHKTGVQLAMSQIVSAIGSIQGCHLTVDIT